jgi:hypothetical protein
MHDLIDAPLWYANVTGQPVLADLHGNQEFFQQDLTGMDVCEFGHTCHFLLVPENLHSVFYSRKLCCQTAT